MSPLGERLNFSSATSRILFLYHTVSHTNIKAKLYMLSGYRSYKKTSKWADNIVLGREWHCSHVNIKIFSYNCHRIFYTGAKIFTSKLFRRLATVNTPYCINLRFGEGGDDDKETRPIDKWLHTQYLDITALHIVCSLSQGHRNCSQPSSHEYAEQCKMVNGDCDSEIDDKFDQCKLELLTLHTSEACHT